MHQATYCQGRNESDLWTALQLWIFDPSRKRAKIKAIRHAV